MQYLTERQRSKKLRNAIFFVASSFSVGVSASQEIPFFTDSSAASMQLRSDFERLYSSKFRIDRVFDLRAWGFDPRSGASIANWIIANTGPVISYRAGPSLCFSDNESHSGDARVRSINGSRVASCAADSLPVGAGYSDFDYSADPHGFLYVAKGGLSLSQHSLNGGYVLNSSQYFPFKSIDSGVYGYRSSPVPIGLETENSKFVYRVASYLGDSLLMQKPTITTCSGLVESQDYVCDSSTDGSFALKGAAMIAMARSCAECSVGEKAILVGQGIDYLFSTPYGSQWSLTASQFYKNVEGELVKNGVDTASIKKKSVMALIK